MAIHAVSGKLGVNLQNTYADSDSDATTKLVTLGTIVEASDGATYQFVHAAGAISQYAWVKVDNDFEAAQLTTAISGDEPTAVGCAQVAIADDAYGWVVRRGPFTGLHGASIAADVKVLTTTSAGKVDDSGGDTIQGVKASAAGTGDSSTTFYATSFMQTNAQD